MDTRAQFIDGLRILCLIVVLGTMLFCITAWAVATEPETPSPAVTTTGTPAAAATIVRYVYPPRDLREPDLLFTLQVVVGLWLAYNYSFTVPQSIVDNFSFATARAMHTNLLVLWMLLGFMGGTYYIVPEETKSEIWSEKLAWLRSAPVDGQLQAARSMAQMPLHPAAPVVSRDRRYREALLRQADGRR